MDSTQFLDGTSDHCAYWLTPPGSMEENEYINIIFDLIADVDVTIMIVKDDDKGKIQYLPRHSFVPIEGRTFSFFLQRKQNKDLEDIREQVKEAQLQGITMEEPPLPKSVLNGNSTSYSILVLIEGQEGKQG
mmetsp:Transcript_4428/g.6512  ORF Transcript_4428/g.6512 Transcript_4428/m.6512 type:complete len:132 (+) Transcript_4428:3183-3578(+)